MNRPVGPERRREGEYEHEYLSPEEPPVVEEEVTARGDYGKARAVHTICAVIDIVCWVFALVLLLHILLVVAGANMGNGFASFIAGWAGGIDFGLDDVFIPADEKMAVLLNQGVAALL